MHLQNSLQSNAICLTWLPPSALRLKWQEAQRIAKRQKELALAAPEEQARIEEEFEATMHDTSLMQLAQVRGWSTGCVVGQRIVLWSTCCVVGQHG